MTDSAADAEALERALHLVLADGGDFAEHVASMLEDRPRREVARFCVFGLQMTNLGLRPWQTAPSDADGGGRDPDADALAERLRRAGLSKFEPHPLEALAKGKRRNGACPLVDFGLD